MVCEHCEVRNTKRTLILSFIYLWCSRCNGALAFTDISDEIVLFFSLHFVRRILVERSSRKTEETHIYIYSSLVCANCYK